MQSCRTTGTCLEPGHDRKSTEPSPDPHVYGRVVPGVGVSKPETNLAVCEKIGEAENGDTQANYKSDVLIMTEHMCLEKGLLSAWLIMHSGPA